MILRKQYMWMTLTEYGLLTPYYMGNGIADGFNTEEDAVEAYSQLKNNSGWSIPSKMILVTEYNAV